MGKYESKQVGAIKLLWKVETATLGISRFDLEHFYERQQRALNKIAAAITLLPEKCVK